MTVQVTIPYPFIRILEDWANNRSIKLTQQNIEDVFSAYVSYCIGVWDGLYALTETISIYLETQEEDIEDILL